MDVSKTVAYKTAKINELNDLASDIDPRLFLFAYYEPKPFPKFESQRIQFITTVINLYGLYWDCGPFVRTHLMKYNPRYPNSASNILPKGQYNQNIRIEMSTRFSNLITVINSFRAISCHNNSDHYYLNEKKVNEASEWCSQVLNVSFLSFDDLTSDDWETLTETLANDAEAVADDIYQCLVSLKNTPLPFLSTLTNVVANWITYGIGRWYSTNKELIKSALAAFYMHFMKGNIDKGQRYGVYDVNLSFEDNLKIWLKTQFGASNDVYSSWVDINYVTALLMDISRCPKPAMPDEVFKELANDVYSLSVNHPLR